MAGTCSPASQSQVCTWVRWSLLALPSTLIATGTFRKDGTNLRGADGLDQATLGDDGGDQARRCNVEGGIVDFDALGRGLSAEAVSHLAGVALLDGNGVAVGRLRSKVLDGAAT